MDYHVPLVSMIKQLFKQWTNGASELGAELIGSVKIGAELVLSFIQQNSNKTALVERSSYLAFAIEILNSAITNSGNELDEIVQKTLLTLG